MLILSEVCLFPIKWLLMRKRIAVLTKDLLIALLVSSSASWYMSLKNLFKAASPSSFSSFSWHMMRQQSCDKKVGYSEKAETKREQLNSQYPIYTPLFSFELPVYPSLLFLVWRKDMWVLDRLLTTSRKVRL